MCKISAQYAKACMRKERKMGGRRPGQRVGQTDGRRVGRTDGRRTTRDHNSALKPLAQVH